MNGQLTLAGVSIGKDESGYFMPSIWGLAVQRPDGKYVVYNDGIMLEVNGLTITGAENYVYRLPSRSVKPGDLIITSENPISVLFVQKVAKVGSRVRALLSRQPRVIRSITGLDPRDSRRVEYVPSRNQFNVQFFVTIVSLMDASHGITRDNSLLPLLLAGNMGTYGENNNILTTFLTMQALQKRGLGRIMQALQKGGLDRNSLIPLMLLKGANSEMMERLLLVDTLNRERNALVTLGR